MTERKLASIERILALAPIPGADAIEVATVRGWKVVVKKGEFIIGDLVVYFEIDSWIPTTLAPFLSKGQEPREFEGIKGERLRTVKLRGQISQGLVLHLGSIDVAWKNEHKVEGTDVTEFLGIVKYDPPIPACLAGVVKGPWPSLVPKTDQERIQNLTAELADWQARDLTFEASEKLDGSSGTFFLSPRGELEVCSRNLNLAKTEGNSFWKIAIKYDLEAKMREDNLYGYAIQGELIGEGIQGNKYGLKGQDFYVFDIYDTAGACYLSRDERNVLTFDLGLRHVPLRDPAFKVVGHTVDSLLALVEGKSALKDTPQEGEVFKCIEDPSISFKVISNLFLAKEK